MSLILVSTTLYLQSPRLALLFKHYITTRKQAAQTSLLTLHHKDDPDAEFDGPALGEHKPGRGHLGAMREQHCVGTEEDKTLGG